MSNPYNPPSKTKTEASTELIEVGSGELDKYKFSYNYLISNRPVILSRGGTLVFFVGIGFSIIASTVILEKIVPGERVVQTKEIVKRPVWYPVALISSALSIPFLLIYFRSRKNLNEPKGMRCRNCKNKISMLNIHLILENGVCDKCKEILINDL